MARKKAVEWSQGMRRTSILAVQLASSANYFSVHSLPNFVLLISVADVSTEGLHPLTKVAWGERYTDQWNTEIFNRPFEKQNRSENYSGAKLHLDHTFPHRPGSRAEALVPVGEGGRVGGHQYQIYTPSGGMYTFQRGSRLVLSIYADRGVLFLPTTNWLHKLIIKCQHFDCWAAVFCPEEHYSPAVETSAFDDEFVKPIRGW